MNGEDVFKALKDEFVSTFMDELIPGMLHNFANPLNGIIGRSKLLQKRIEENIRKTRENFPEAASAMLEEHNRMKADIETISRESDKFFDIFRDVTEKFYVIAATESEKIDLSKVIETEMRFADFYLDFKHEVRKDLQLDRNLPEISGLSSDYSMFFWAIMKYSKNRMKTCATKEFSITTAHDDQHIFLKIKDSGDAVPEEQRKALLDCVSSDQDIPPRGDLDSGLLHALLLLKRYDADFQMQSEGDGEVISIKIPYKTSRSAGGN